jgi:hypothetical protein
MSLALGAVPRGADSIITIMTLQGTIPEMIGEGHTAVRTFEGEATIRTEYKIGKSSSIEKKEALLFVFDIFLKGHLYLP